MKSILLFLYTETSLHVGTGSGLSAIDLPIQRERTTGYPNIQGSGLKGALRNQCGALRNQCGALRNQRKGLSAEISAVFGPEVGQNASDHAGAVSFGEARTVLFPVRSLKGVFAYITCPHVLSRLARDVKSAGLSPLTPPTSGVSIGTCLVNSKSAVSDEKGTVVLEEFSFSAAQSASSEVDAISTWLVDRAIPADTVYGYWQEKLKSSLVILSDEDFCDFVMHSTEVSPRVRLDPATKTVAGTGLWTQEALPSDTLMVSVVTAQHVRLPVKNNRGEIVKPLPETLTPGEPDNVITWLTQEEPDRHLPGRVQIGGDETTGQGFIALRWYAH